MWTGVNFYNGGNKMVFLSKKKKIGLKIILTEIYGIDKQIVDRAFDRAEKMWKLA